MAISRRTVDTGKRRAHVDETILFILSAAVFAVYAYLFLRAPTIALHGVQSAWLTFTKALPWMGVSILLAGLFEHTFDQRLLHRLFGPQSGLRGVALAALLGSLGTGSRWGVYPLAAVMLASRASLGAVMAFTTAWMLISLPRTAAEFPFFGIRLTFARMALSYLAALVAGSTALLFSRGWPI